MSKDDDRDVIDTPEAGIQPVLPGFYDLLYEEREIDDLNRNLFGDLVAEICLLRVILRRALTQANEIQDLSETLRVLNVVGLAAMRLARLLEVQFKLSERSNQGSDAFTQALLEMGEKLGIE